MRILMIIHIPVEKGNAASKDGSMGTKFQSMLGDAKPESAYFAADNGERTAFIVVNIDDASQIPALAEPWFLAFNARVQLHPCMSLEDLERAMPSTEAAVKKYA